MLHAYSATTETMCSVATGLGSMSVCLCDETFEQLRLHLELLTARYIECGMSRNETRLAEG